MNEVWKQCPTPFEKYSVSNLGNCKGCYGLLKLQVHIDRYIKGTPHFVAYWILYANKKRHFIHANTLIYKVFGKGYINGVQVYRRDGDVYNNAIDNLFICKGYTKPVSSDQLAIFEKSVFPCVKHYLKVRNILDMKKKGFDIDNIIGNACMLIYQHLAQYKSTYSFYTFCRKYVEFAFQIEYRQYKRFLGEYK